MSFDKKKWRAELEAVLNATTDDMVRNEPPHTNAILALLERAYAEGRASHGEVLGKLEAIEQRAASALQSMLYTPPWGESQAVFATLIQRIGEQLDAMKAALAAARKGTP